MRYILIMFLSGAAALAGSRDDLMRSLNAIGAKQLAAREKEVAGIKSKEELERRKLLLREKILRAIGGLPERRGGLNVRPVGTLERDGYRIEKIIFESLPQFYVTANVFVPAAGAGPFPAVVMPVGHGVEGKASKSQVTLAVGLAKKGFVALTYDPIGQGERLQYYDAAKKASTVGGPTAEHSYANGHTLLIGDNVARCRIFDGMRALDYLETRPDVDRERLGATGCSGGGTVTTYLAALDNRVKVAAPACYITSWEALLAGPGPQDAEQTFPNFLRDGLNMGDYIALFAPKPYLIASTTEDFFPLAGARQVYEEARRLYGLYGAEEKIRHQVGPGGHGVPLENREAIYGWFQKWLNKGEGEAKEPAIQPDTPESLRCTATGQVADSLGGETVFTLNRKRAADLIPPQRKRSRAELAADIRELTAVIMIPGGPPPAEAPGVLRVPEGSGPKPAVLVLDPKADVEALVRAGQVVLSVPGWGAPARAGVRGDYGLAMLAAVVGKNIVGLRVEEIIRAVDYLASRPEVDRKRISARARGIGETVALLHAAVLDERIGAVTVEEGLSSCRAGVDQPVYRGLYDAAIPGVLRRYDLAELGSFVQLR